MYFARELDFGLWFKNPKNPKNPISGQDCRQVNPKNPKNPISGEDCRQYHSFYREYTPITFKKMGLFEESIYLFKWISSFKVEYIFKREKAPFEKNLFLLKRTYCFQAEIHSFLKRIYSFKENILILKTMYTSFLDNTFLVEKVLRYIPLKTMYLFQDNRTFWSRVFTFWK